MGYQNSKAHKENAAAARLKAVEWNKQQRLNRIKEYELSPKLCKQCNNPIHYDKQMNSFCSKSCSAAHNNKRRVVSDEQKTKVSKSLKYRAFEKQRDKSPDLKFENYKRIRVKPPPKYTPVFYQEACKVCGKGFYTRKYNPRVTCSKIYWTIAVTKNRTYQNGSRKTTWFYNPYEAKEVLLESSWEVNLAEFLIQRNIHWIRPEPISWTDYKGKERLYWPDFYLKDYDLYLDPKNPYCMEMDREKMSIITSMVDIWYGNLDDIKKNLENYVGQGPQNRTVLNTVQTCSMT